MGKLPCEVKGWIQQPFEKAAGAPSHPKGLELGKLLRNIVPVVSGSQLPRAVLCLPVISFFLSMLFFPFYSTGVGTPVGTLCLMCLGLSRSVPVGLVSLKVPFLPSRNGL